MLNLELIEFSFLHHLILDQDTHGAETSKKKKGPPLRDLQQQTCVKLNVLEEDLNLKMNVSRRSKGH